jgi:hypothetical protein
MEGLMLVELLFAIPTGIAAGYLLRLAQERWQARRADVNEESLVQAAFNAAMNQPEPAPEPEPVILPAPAVPALKDNRPLCSQCGKDYGRLPYGFCQACNEALIPKEG